MMSSWSRDTGERENRRIGSFSFEMEANTRHEQDRTLRRTVRAESRAIDSSPMESASETVLLQVTSSEIRYGSILSQRSGSPVVGEVWPLRGRLSRARSKCAGRWRDLLGHVWSRALRIRTEPKRADMHADAHEERGESNDPPSRNPYVVVVDDFFEVRRLLSLPSVATHHSARPIDRNVHSLRQPESILRRFCLKR